MFLNAKCVHEREYVRVLGAVADPNLLVLQNRVAHMRPVFFGLCAVQPKRIPALREEFARQVVPKEVAPFRVRGVVNVSVRNVQMLLRHPQEILGL